ncbi:beta-hexosaminidase subunit alpha-like isoform X3 [Dinothrombium tinctorium]|uniref:Beta-hexosaminidase n=1 Tax=Dinothrombium tinctorium TaxID=1965070 RepID=A0A3S3NTI7_9ACAR|nr:beta-hexosaminidase subunit alpha-like isoform X3 [Dinothrombium tinctorium]
MPYMKRSLLLTRNTPERVELDTTIGPWPYPQRIEYYDDFYYINRETFRFKIVNNSQLFNCDILLNAISRYNDLIFNNFTLRNNLRLKELHSLEIYVKGGCEQWPRLDMDESYTLDLLQKNLLSSRSVWGALRGLETFSQLIDKNFIINKTYIEDFPRFAHRGLLVDTARHYMPMSILLRNLDAMAYNKLNVFHWHIVDDNSFPFVSKLFPQLSDKGAYNKHTHVYTPENVKTILEYARLRGIRVIVEFDTPGHTLAWGKGIKDLVLDCSSVSKQYSGLSLKGSGVLQVTKESTYDFLKKFFGEIAETFPDEYIHIGGDEVASECWTNNGQENLYQLYMKRFANIIKELRKKYIVWQEVFEEDLYMHPETIVQVWKSWTQPEEVTRMITERGFRVISSASWYLDMISYKKDWIDYYKYDPHTFYGNQTQKNLVIGGEACVWSEYIDETNFLSRTWPRASAVAERLWSSKHVADSEKASPRFDRFRCLMKERGIPAHPINGPGFCEHFVLPISDKWFSEKQQHNGVVFVYASKATLTSFLVVCGLLMILLLLVLRPTIKQLVRK